MAEIISDHVGENVDKSNYSFEIRKKTLGKDRGKTERRFK
jgi:hypothetical protein